VITAHAIANTSKTKKGKATGWTIKDLREEVLSFLSLGVEVMCVLFPAFTISNRSAMGDLL